MTESKNQKYHNHQGVLDEATIFDKHFPLAIIGCLESEYGRAHIISTVGDKSQLITFLEGTLKGLRGRD